MEVTGSDPRWSAILAVVGAVPEVHRDAVGDALCEAYSYGVERGVERGQLDLRDSEPEPERYEAVAGPLTDATHEEGDI